MICPSCRFDVPNQMKFCVNCGISLYRGCPSCGASMMIAYRFCGDCGTELEVVGVEASSPPPERRAEAPPPAGSASAPAAASPELQKPARAASASPAEQGERKQVTVLCCEVVSSNPNDPPDVLHGLLNRFFELAQTEIERYEGTVSRFLAKGLVALFGAPIAHEDHPRRGTLAAWGMKERLAGQAADLQKEFGIECSIRVGLDTGQVVLGGRGATALGRPIHTATRLQQAAKPGEVLLSDAIARLVEHQVVLENRPALPATDDSPQIAVWEATATDRAFTTATLFHTANLSPLVGRESELATLEQLRDRANDGQGQVIGISGGSGMGKSRLLHELYRRTFPSFGASYLRGQCQSYAAGIPYFPLIDMIRKASRITEADPPDLIVRKLRSAVEQIGTDPESLPFFLRLLGVQEGTEALDELEPQALKARTFAAMRRMLLDAAQERLVVVEIEDTQWIDQTSEEFLNSLIDVAGAARILLLLSYRTGNQPPRWLEKSYAAQISMNRLTLEESRGMIADLLRRADVSDERISTELESDIIDKAEGNPLFLEELARAMLERGDDPDTAIPGTIQGILMARIDRLPDEHKRLLRTASVLGREVHHDLLRAVWTSENDPMPLLNDLRDWELLYRLPSEDQEVSCFTHALTRDVAYESLLSTQLKETHRRAAEALEQLYEDHLDDAYDRLIYHYPRAGDAEKTVQYLGLFATQAARSYAHAEAAQALRESLSQCDQLPDDQRDRKSIETLLQLADSLLPLASFPETRELLEKYREHLDRLDDDAFRPPYFFWLAHTYTYLGDQELTREHAQTAIEAAKAVEDEINEGRAWYVLGRDGFWSGRFSDGIEASVRAVVLLERNGEAWWQGQADWVAGFNHYALGRFEEGIEALERARRIGEALDDYRLDTSWSLGYFYASLGAADEGVEQCRRGLEGAKDPLNQAVAQGFLGHAYLQRGQVDEAIESLQSSVGALKAAGMLQLQGWFAAFLAEALAIQERRDEALEHAREALEATRAAQFPYGIGLAQHALGAISDDQEALQSALEYFEEIEVPFEAARTRLNLARLLAAADDGARAHEVLDAAQNAFSNLGVPVFEEEAARLADELQASA